MEKTNSALYRKYRPAKWEDVRGQDHIISVLDGMVNKGNISHAYLFSGGRGTGKTTVARILASSLGIASNDIYEIDAASNRGIDDVRELRQSVNALPLESPYKAYIIDEAHMLTKEAFNALLKTLEEPPSYVVFMLATTEVEKIPDTIISRCQAFMFKKPQHMMLKEFAIDMARKENVKLDAAAADLVAVLGDGSFRDTLGILQKIISFSSEKEIKYDIISSILDTPSPDIVNDVIVSIANEDIEKGLSAIEEAADQNIDMKIFTKLTTRKLRAILLLRFAPEMKDRLAEDFSDIDMDFLEKIAKSSQNINSQTLRKFLSVYQSVSNAYIPQLPLELALVELIGNNTE